VRNAEPAQSVRLGVELGLTLLYVEDFPRMLAFYRDVLGLPLGGEDPGAGHDVGRDWVQFRTEGGGALELFDHARFGRSLDFPYPRTNANVVTFRVESVDAEADRLRELGVELRPIHRAEWGAAVHFFDPEGNHLQLYEVA
jgi:catechol 2,3-dioxygenase-like lactoylglutathione lyase family enzyme